MDPQQLLFPRSSESAPLTSPLDGRLTPFMEGLCRILPEYFSTTYDFKKYLQGKLQTQVGILYSL